MESGTELLPQKKEIDLTIDTLNQMFSLFSQYPVTTRRIPKPAQNQSIQSRQIKTSGTGKWQTNF